MTNDIKKEQSGSSVAAGVREQFEVTRYSYMLNKWLLPCCEFDTIEDARKCKREWEALENVKLRITKTTTTTEIVA